MAQGALLINEIAWMGTSVGPNEEWIELYNSGTEDVSVDGWVLTDTVSLYIPLAGTVGAGDFAVLERTDDSSAPEVTMFLRYTGALSNDGRTLTLCRESVTEICPSGSIEDQIAGGEGWGSVGGDNETKETAQRTLSGWRGGTPTPGYENESTARASSNSEAATNSETQHSNTTSQNIKKGIKKTTKIKSDDTELELTLQAPSVAYVNQVVAFEMIPKGAGKTILNSLSYMWNFGDTYTGVSKNPIHAFAYPGEYVVVVEAIFGKQKAITRHEIVVLPISLTLEVHESGDILIHNNARYEVDISGYQLKGKDFFVFPKHTIIKSNGTLTVSALRVGGNDTTEFSLHDSERRLLVSTGAIPSGEGIAPQPYVSAHVYTEPAYTAEDISTTVSSEPVVVEDEIIRIGDDIPEVVDNTRTPYSKTHIAFGVCMVIGILALYIRRGA